MRHGGGARSGAAMSGDPVAGLGSLWFGLFGAPGFWSVQLIATYAVAAHACFPRRQPLLGSSAPAVWGAVCIIIVVALAGSIAALLTAMAASRALREAPQQSAGHVDGARERARFMAHSGIMMSVLFTGAVALSAIALFLTPVCW